MNTYPARVQWYVDEGGTVVGRNMDGNWLVDLDGYRLVVPTMRRQVCFWLAPSSGRAR